MIKVKIDRKTRKVLIENKGHKIIDSEIKKSLFEIGQLMEKETKKGIKNPPKTGRKYQNLPNRSSKQGEYPANQFGNLKKSINFKVEGSRKMIFGASAKYAKYLEENLKRKILGFTIEQNKNKIKDIIRKNVNSGLK